MRTQKQLVFYESVLDVLHESGCPFCRFLKEYQAARLQNRPEKETHSRGPGLHQAGRFTDADL